MVKKGDIVQVKAIAFGARPTQKPFEQSRHSDFSVLPPVPSSIIDALRRADWKWEPDELYRLANNDLLTVVCDPDDKYKTDAHYRGTRRRCIYRVEMPGELQGLVVGKSRLDAGWVEAGHYDEPPYFVPEKQIPMIRVQPLYTVRWLNPWCCLEEDLKKL